LCQDIGPLKNDWSSRQNIEDVQDLDQARRIITLLVRQNKILVETIKTLSNRVKELEAEQSKNSKNSSKPPSNDGDSKPQPKSLRTTSGKKSGGPPGHQGHRLERTSTPDNIEYHEATICHACVYDCTSVPTERDETRQGHDIPPLRIQITDPCAEVKKCPDGASKVKGQFPEGVSHYVQ